MARSDENISEVLSCDDNIRNILREMHIILDNIKIDHDRNLNDILIELSSTLCNKIKERKLLVERIYSL